MVAYASKGALSVDVLYNMPIYLRNFYINELTDVKRKEEEAYNSVKKSTNRSKR
jgi:hypothetical protein